MKRYVLIAGVNGAGKSTLYRAIDSIQELPRINTDEIVKVFGRWDNKQDMFKASKIAVKKIKEYFNSNTSFNQETTLCGKSIIANIDKAKSLGYYIELHYVSVENVDIALERISHRVKAGGHGIPEKDVRRRFDESLNSLVAVLPKCDQVILYDNTIGFNRFAIYENGILRKISSNTPEWYKKLQI